MPANPRNETPQPDRYEEDRLRWIGTFGSPEYGGWARDPVDRRYKPQQVIEALGRVPE